MTDEEKKFRIDLHTGLQDALDAIHKEYCDNLREKNSRIYQAIVNEKLNSENSVAA